jgi:hypothetical protein
MERGETVKDGARGRKTRYTTVAKAATRRSRRRTAAQEKQHARRRRWRRAGRRRASCSGGSGPGAGRGGPGPWAPAGRRREWAVVEGRGAAAAAVTWSSWPPRHQWVVIGWIVGGARRHRALARLRHRPVRVEAPGAAPRRRLSCRALQHHGRRAHQPGLLRLQPLRHGRGLRARPPRHPPGARRTVLHLRRAISRCLQCRRRFSSSSSRCC